MRRIVALGLAVVLSLSLAACGANESAGSSEPEVISENQTEVDASEENQADVPAVEEEDTSMTEDTEESGSRVLIAYFSVPEDIDTTDAVAGASIVVDNGEKIGNTEYVAKLIQETVGGDLFRIETVDAYPLDHDTLVDQAAEEQDENKRPELNSQVENFEQYETVILGFPNWWADLPMPVYTFLEEYNFEGKPIIPFVTHGGSGFSGTISTIAELQPNAYVSDNTLSLSRNNVADSESEVIRWAEGLELAAISEE